MKIIDIITLINSKIINDIWIILQSGYALTKSHCVVK